MTNCATVHISYSITPTAPDVALSVKLVSVLQKEIHRLISKITVAVSFTKAFLFLNI